MTTSTDEDMLLNLRKRLESEIEALLMKVASRRKGIDSINTTLSLLRGYEIQEEQAPANTALPVPAPVPVAPVPDPVVPKPKMLRVKHDVEGIRSALLDFGAALNGKPFLLRDVSQYLVDRKLLDPGTRRCDTTYRYVNECGLFRRCGMGMYEAIPANDSVREKVS